MLSKDQAAEGVDDLDDDLGRGAVGGPGQDGAEQDDLVVKIQRLAGGDIEVLAEGLDAAGVETVFEGVGVAGLGAGAGGAAVVVAAGLAFGVKRISQNPSG